MNDDVRDNLTPVQQRARDTVRGLSRPVADVEFRARLRTEFTTGTIQGGRVLRPPRSVWRRTAMPTLA
ncbi:hypothetical protein KJ554_02755, partial [bacterium]|nr:hypothetical protein [bacterium]